MTNHELAAFIVHSIDRHGLRGLIYDQQGMDEVVMHGRVNMLKVAEDVLAALEPIAG